MLHWFNTLRSLYFCLDWHSRYMNAKMRCLAQNAAIIQSSETEYLGGRAAGVFLVQLAFFSLTVCLRSGSSNILALSRVEI